MHTKIYRIASSKYGILLFPTPVDKQSMYLINAPTLFHAEVYKHLLDFAALFSPLISKNQYEKVAVHSDGVTEIFDLNWNTMQLSFLPEKHLDLKRATILESLFTKKFKHLFLYPDSRCKMMAKTGQVNDNENRQKITAKIVRHCVA